MTDRAHFVFITAGRWFVTVLVVITCFWIVVEEALSAPSLAAGEVKQVCGLCHVDWRRQATALLSIGALLAVVSVVARSGVAPTVFRGGDDE